MELTREMKKKIQAATEVFAEEITEIVVGHVQAHFTDRLDKALVVLEEARDGGHFTAPPRRKPKPRPKGKPGPKPGSKRKKKSVGKKKSSPKPKKEKKKKSTPSGRVMKKSKAGYNADRIKALQKIMKAMHALGGVDVSSMDLRKKAGLEISPFRAGLKIIKEEGLFAQKGTRRETTYSLTKKGRNGKPGDYAQATSNLQRLKSKMGGAR